MGNPGRPDPIQTMGGDIMAHTGNNLNLPNPTTHLGPWMDTDTTCPICWGVETQRRRWEVDGEMGCWHYRCKECKDPGFLTR